MTPRTEVVRVGVVAEDRRLVDFLRPWIFRIARERDVRAVLSRTELTHGCSGARLRDWIGRLESDCDILVLAADAGGRGHRKSRRTFRQKSRDLLALAGPSRPAVVTAVAEPSVEGWLLSDAHAFAAGIGEGTGATFVPPSDWPRPVGELEAKQALGRVVEQGLNGPLPRSGFEFAASIVERMDPASSDSLDSWVRAFARELDAAGKRA